MITALLIATLTVTSVATEMNADLVSAAKHNDILATMYALDHGAEIDATDDLGFTALMYTARRTELTLFDLFIERGADVNVRNNAGATAIFVAARNGNIQAVARLIAAGADLTIQNHNGQTAYDVAVIYQKPMIAALIKRHQQAQLARM